MKNIFGILALLITVASSAQVNNFTLPWNPDANSDQIIGVTDLQSLLAVYGQTYSSESIFVTADSTHMLLKLDGETNYWQCLGRCDNLIGDWWMADMLDYSKHYDALFPVINPQSVSPTYWVKTVPNTGGELSMNVEKTPWFNASSSEQHVQEAYPNSSMYCFCATQELPRVEYSYCQDDDNLAFQACADDKVANGWYPLHGIATLSYNGFQKVQAFWRRAE